MSFFFLPKEESRKITFKRIVLASLVGHIKGWLTVLLLMFINIIVAHLVHNPPSDAGQGEGLLTAFVLVVLPFSFLLSLPILIYVARTGFCTFGASLVVGLVFSIVFSLAALTYAVDASRRMSREFEFVEAILSFLGIAGVYGLSIATSIWISMSRAYPDIYSSDWIKQKPNRKYVVYLPFFLAFLIIYFSTYHNL
jgi:hypothetical protein